MNHIGTVEVVLEKTAKSGKAYKSYKIGEDWYNDFQNKDYGVAKGDSVGFDYEQNGDFRNLTAMEPVAAQSSKAEKFSQPFLGMCLNQAIQVVTAHQGEGKAFDYETYKIVAKRLFEVNTELKNELESNS